MMLVDAACCDDSRGVGANPVLNMCHQDTRGGNPLGFPRWRDPETSGTQALGFPCPLDHQTPFPFAVQLVTGSRVVGGG